MKLRSGCVATLCSLACGACGLLLEDNPKFSAGLESSESVGDEDTDEDADEDSETGGEIPHDQPPQPIWLTVHTLGNPEDADVEPLGPGLVLVGGGDPGAEAWMWQASLIPGGDVVVLQVEGEPMLDHQLYNDIGGVDSVQTVIVQPGAASFEPWIAWTLAHAEAIVIVGEDPYDMLWKSTPIEAAIMATWRRGAVVGGVDAGLSSLGEFVYAGYGGDLSSSEALEDPYDDDMTIDRNYLSLEPLEDTLIEARFSSEDRMGRLLTFAARVLEDDWSSTFVGLGIDEHTAMLIGPDGVGRVSGSGHVYLFRTEQRPAVCEPDEVLEFGPVTVARLAAGDTATWPGGSTDVAGSPVTATGGGTDPADPY